LRAAETDPAAKAAQIAQTPSAPAMPGSRRRTRRVGMRGASVALMSAATTHPAPIPAMVASKPAAM
jgi:hypothetical protein